MADDDGESRQWIVEPPGPGEVSLYLAGGEGVDLTTEQEAALGALLRTLEAGDAEVVGLTKDCPQLSMCGLSCTKMGCWPALQCDPLTRNAGGATRSAATAWNLMGSFDPRVG